jgi:hypothetical protein
MFPCSSMRTIWLCFDGDKWRSLKVKSPGEALERDWRLSASVDIGLFLQRHCGSSVASFPLALAGYHQRQGYKAGQPVRNQWYFSGPQHSLCDWRAKQRYQLFHNACSDPLKLIVQTSRTIWMIETLIAFRVQYITIHYSTVHYSTLQ